MNAVNQDGRHERICPLFTNDTRFPKLDVAGSIPVSRSMFSMTWEEPKNTPYAVSPAT